MAAPEAANDGHPVIEFVGDIPIVLPMASDYLRQGDIDALKAIAEEVRRGRSGQAQRMALALEKRLGITAAARFAAMKAHTEDERILEGALVRAAATTVPPPQESRKQQKRRRAPFSALREIARHDARPMELPAKERGRTAVDLKRWNRVRDKLRAPDSNLSPEDRDALAVEMRQIEEAVRDRGDADALKAHLDEQERRARDAGEVVARNTKTGRVNVLSWDAVKALAQAKVFTADQFETATQMKALYEARQADAGALEYGDTRGSGHNHEAFVANRFERARASADIALVERAISLRAEPNCLKMFRWVVGENHALSAQGKGRAFERNLACLLTALDVARAKRIDLAKERALGLR